jgi:hypothetical protein
MTGILELFASLSEPDEFEVQAQLELFAWGKRTANRDSHRRWLAKAAPDQLAAIRESNREAQRRYAAKVKADPEKAAARRAYERERYARLKRAA